MQAGQRQAIVPAANIGGGQADHGNSHQGQAALGTNLEGKLMLLLGLLTLTVIGLITAGLLLPVHTGKLCHGKNLAAAILDHLSGVFTCKKARVPDKSAVHAEDSFGE